MSDTTVTPPAGYLSAATSKAALDAMASPKFDHVHGALMHGGTMHVFETAYGAVSVVLGFAPDGNGPVAYEVTLSVTGEIFVGMDFPVPSNRHGRDRNAALALIDAIGRTSGDAYLCEYVATQSPAWLLPV